MGITLGIDTSTDVRAGIARNGRSMGSGIVADQRAHAEQLAPLVQRTLAGAGLRLSDVDDIAVGVGPGPFTGLRVGVVTAMTWASVLNRPIKGVCSLDVVARQWVQRGTAPEEFVVVTDARRREVYWARYNSLGERLDGPVVTAPTEVPELPLAGSGAKLLERPVAGPTELDAGLLAAVAAQLPDAGLEPLYLRRPDAEVPSTRKSTLPQPRLSLKKRRT